MALWRVEDPTEFGIVGLSKENQGDVDSKLTEGYISRFKEKPTVEEAFSNLYQFKKLHVSPKEKNLSFFLDVKTKYEQKAINKGIAPSYLVYKKV